jgi:hypothetical protein
MRVLHPTPAMPSLATYKNEILKFIGLVSDEFGVLTTSTTRRPGTTTTTPLPLPTTTEDYYLSSSSNSKTVWSGTKILLHLNSHLFMKVAYHFLNYKQALGLISRGSL